MKIIIVKKGNKNAKPVNYCAMLVDDVATDKK